MAKNAGVKAVGVSWGYHGEVTLREHGADKVADRQEAYMKLFALEIER